MHAIPEPYVLGGARRKKSRSKKSRSKAVYSNASADKTAAPKPKKSESPWDIVWDIIKSVPWWIVKFIDWTYTVITAILIYFVSK